MSRWLIILVLSLGVSCSSPLRETSEPPQPAEPQVAAGQTAAPPTARPTVVNPPPAATPEEIAPPVAVTAAPAEKPAPARALAAPDPVKELFAAEARRVERERTIARLASERDAAAAVVAQRQKDLLALKNPFLPRPQFTFDESTAIKGLGGAARARWAEGRVAEAQALLDAAQKAYDDAKANP